jgi:hypothetical protein
MVGGESRSGVRGAAGRALGYVVALASPLAAGYGAHVPKPVAPGDLVTVLAGLARRDTEAAA